ncbi:hypothetical protein SNOG_03491 [Parastagonospora nodorum SN15]|uniref:Uncharacterized protein n=1 Tax=Phaeosphaeria nodorum (strain SN15 / ATCC MYA-4574 / FGSC 10173) TaxID=321614 RepID=Q0UXM3_PHANO|nr:hypothetical protein SNOG_03491 [Parastagonospora nodorum SN15]EAT88696.1 hypothetical protein SNOG_03491 [Parastagonospora nodorum SN15]
MTGLAALDNSKTVRIASGYWVLTLPSFGCTRSKLSSAIAEAVAHGPHTTANLRVPD